MKISDEQYADIGTQVLGAWQAGSRDVAFGRAAVAAVAPLLLSEPSDEEIRKVGSGYLWRGADFVRCKGVFRDRLASLTAKPDPLRIALSRWVSEADMDAAVAAVDAARAK